MKELWKPQPRQAQALSNNAFELLFGGAAGGGKSDFLLADFVSHVNDWRQAWRGVLFRKTYPELETIIARAKELYLPLRATWNQANRTFTFPPGSQLQMRFLESDDDVTRYQGQEYTWVGFDELGNYPTDYPWKYMMSRLRSAVGAPCYIRGTANPGGRGHGWIKERFIDGKEPGKVYRIGNTGITRCFIPSLLQDNQILMQQDPMYQKRLELMPVYLRKALLEGDWNIFQGQVFEEFNTAKHVVKPFALPAGMWKRFYSLDWGYSKPFSLGKWAVDAEGRLIRYGEWYGYSKENRNTGLKLGAEEVAEKAWADAVTEGVTECVADPAIWGKTDSGPTVAEKFQKAGFKMIPGNNDRVNGLVMFHQMLISMGEDSRPMLMVFNVCTNFIRIIPTLTPDPHRPEDIDSKLEDHIYDETRYAVMCDFVHKPVNALRRQNASWNFGKQRQGNSWNPLA